MGNAKPVIRVSEETRDALRGRKCGAETYDDVIRRELGLDDDE